MKNLTSGILLVLIILISSMLICAFNIQSVKGTGTIYIRADGSVDPPTAPIKRDGDIYTFTENIFEPIVVQRGNIVIDGAGYMLVGGRENAGLNCSCVSNVTIQNTVINNFKCGIFLYSSSNNTISGNNIANNEYGIRLVSSSNNIISGNSIASNGYGIWLNSSSNNIINGNNITINYYVGLVLYSSSNNTISENKITDNTFGVALLLSSNNVIGGNNITNNEYGMMLSGSSRNSIIGNIIIANNGGGVGLSGSSSNSISENIIIANNGESIYLRDSSSNIISGNNITNNEDGIFLRGSSSNHISGNIIIANDKDGISLLSSSNNSIFGNNIIANNWSGIFLYDSSNNSISGNVFVGDGLFVWSSYSNEVVDNVVNNKPLVYLEGISDYTVADAGQVILIKCNNINVENLNLYNTTVAVELYETNNTKIAKNNITNNFQGIVLAHSSYNCISENNITNKATGIYLCNSSNNSISGNNIIANNWSGILGILLRSSSNNRFYHNNFINNTWQVDSDGSPNVWDDGYSSGGNYWSDYTGVDVKRGPGQDLPGSDGIGDTPYVIDANNIDRYPLMNPYGASQLPTYSLIIMTTAGGTTNPAPGTYTYAAGTELNVTATPNTGYSFAHWLLDGQKRTENPITVLMDANHTLIAHFVDDIKPEIGEPSQNPPPENVQPYQDVTVTVIVTDYGSGVKNVTLWYNLNNGTTWITLNMTELAANTYQATIPGYGNCTWITYKIVAYDNAENMAVKDNNGYNYQYHVIPEYPPATLPPL
ncbi:MAG: NosD domain-containing protein, partial [Nitrososphaerota archaeon]